MTGEALYFEDLEIGRVVETPGQTLTEADVVRFAGLTGEWDERFANVEIGRSRGEGGRLVPELLALCLSSGLGWRGPQPPIAILAFMGFEWRILAPLHVGDTVRTRSRMMAKRSLRDGGVVVEERQIVNQRDEAVQSCKVTLLVARRPV